jgi:DNA polymerase III subunit epsilon
MKMQSFFYLPFTCQFKAALRKFINEYQLISVFIYFYIMYAIIDIETTGGSPVTEKVTEIAIFIYDGQRVVEEYSTLINPEKKIPYYISALTGITNAMVNDAPKFYEVARRIVELTENCIFVAHNVSFDYQFIRNEFKRLGYEFTREKLCTVQLSRRLIPGLPSYSLGKICKQIGIEIRDRHHLLCDGP